MAKLTKEDFTVDEDGDYHAGSHWIVLHDTMAGFGAHVGSMDWSDEDTGRGSTVDTSFGFGSKEDALQWGIDCVNDIPLRLACAALEIAFASMEELFPLAVAAIDQARAEGAETARKHRYTCDVCGKRAVYEQCGAMTVCEEHIHREGSWWLIDETSARYVPWDQVEERHRTEEAVTAEREACARVAQETADRWSKAEQFVEAARSDASYAPAFDSHANSAHCVGARQASSEIAEAIRARGRTSSAERVSRDLYNGAGAPPASDRKDGAT